MDVFTIILLFLLKSYSAQGDIMSVDSKLTLPVSTSTEITRGSLLLQVTSKDIIVEGDVVVSVKDAMAGNAMLVEPLFAKLNEIAKRTEFIAQKNTALNFTGLIVIQGDKRISFRLLEKVMYTSGQAGYNGISLAVTKGE
jgi:biopolymer transport protein ExbD